MKRGLDFIWPVIGLSAVAFSIWLLSHDKQLRDLGGAEILSALRAIPLSHWAAAMLSTAVAYGALAWYDRIALLHLGRKLSWLFISLTSFTTYALSHNIGMSMFSGALIRYRAYSTKGLTLPEIGFLVAMCSFTFALGVTLLGGVVLVIEPEISQRLFDFPVWISRAAGAAMLGVVALYAIGSLLHFKPLQVGGLTLIYPRPPILLRQLVAAPLELMAAAGIIYFALPAAYNPGFLTVLGIFLASFSAALLSHAPGGLGVLEFVVLKAMPNVPTNQLAAALIVFRLFYLVLPLLIGLTVAIIFERGRFLDIRAGLRAKK